MIKKLVRVSLVKQMKLGGENVLYSYPAKRSRVIGSDVQFRTIDIPGVPLYCVNNLEDSIPGNVYTFERIQAAAAPAVQLYFAAIGVKWLVIQAKYPQLHSALPRMDHVPAAVIRMGCQ